MRGRKDDQRQVVAAHEGSTWYLGENGDEEERGLCWLACERLAHAGEHGIAVEDDALLPPGEGVAGFGQRGSQNEHGRALHRLASTIPQFEINSVFIRNDWLHSAWTKPRSCNARLRTRMKGNKRFGLFFGHYIQSYHRWQTITDTLEPDALANIPLFFCIFGPVLRP